MTQYTGGILTTVQKRDKSNTTKIFILAVFGFACLVAARWYFDEQPAQADGREKAAQVSASETPEPTMTPRPTYNFVIDTVQAGQLEVIAQEKLNLAAQGTLQVEEANARLRFAERESEAQLTRQAVMFTFAMTSTQQADAMQIATVREAVEDDKRTVRAWNDLLMVFAFVGFALVCTMFWITFLAIIRRIISAWDEAGQPAPVDNQIVEIFTDGNITRPLAGLDITPDELTIIAGVVQQGRGLIVRAIEEAGIPSERWAKIRQQMLDRGLIEVTNVDAQRIRVAPTGDGWALFNEYAESDSPHSPAQE